MHLLARHSNGHSVVAWEADKGIDYCCLECGDPVRLRGGAHRQSHFYHLSPRTQCRQSGKSLTHLQIQLALLHLLPQGEGALEVRFSSIHRIADVVWRGKRLIFEIQCSPITPKEVLERNQDYASIGFQVVWILHDQCFNQVRLTAAEQALKPHPHYFTNFNAEGEGFFYDQVHLEKRGRRQVLISKLPLSLHQPVLAPFSLPRTLSPRQTWKACFQGDIRTVLPRYQSLLTTSFSWFSPLRTWYKAFFHSLLEKTSGS